MDAVTFKIGDVVEVRYHPAAVWVGARFRVTDTDYDLVNGVRVHNPHDPRHTINNIRVGEHVGFFRTRLVKVGREGFGSWFKRHAL